ncbi:MAG: hypothetical protein DHS20C03_32860 [Minwuia thermotolerans]|nr:MAG: hypothetical protein DHS20C03_32860 [Minwuia thermotolerans]
MSHTPHELAEEFPDKVQKMHELNGSDAHFRKLAERYHAVNRDIHRAETNVEPTDQFTEEKMRKERLSLKDQIAVMLA